MKNALRLCVPATGVRNGYIWEDGGQNDGLPCPLTGAAAEQSPCTNNRKVSRTGFCFDRSPLFASGRRPIRAGDKVMQVSCQLWWSHREASISASICGRSSWDEHCCEGVFQEMANGVGEIEQSINAGHRGKTALEEEIARIAIQGEPSASVAESNKSAERKGGKKERKRKKRRPAEGDSESDRD